MPIFRAMTCIDEFSHSFSSIVETSIVNFYNVASKKLKEEVDTGIQSSEMYMQVGVWKQDYLVCSIIIKSHPVCA